MGLAHRLYRGETTFPLIRRKRIFYLTSLALVSLCLISMATLRFNLGVEFKGGATFQWPSQGASISEARELFDELGQDDAIVQTVGRGSDSDLRVQTPPLSGQQTDQIIAGIERRFPGVAVSPSNVGPAWGDRVTTKALQGLGLFLVAVMVYISIRFEPKMAVAATVALLHDLILTAGLYSLTQFVVTPSTIIALLTVLGYSLYDTIVVFDKVEENTKGLAGSSQSTYSEAVELAANQTFMRSVNTSLIALLPVSGLLFVGAFLLGAGTLKDLALALFVGLASGAYSSLFLASPILADLKEREPQFKALSQRVLARRSGTAMPGPSSARAAARGAGAGTLPADTHADPPQVAVPAGVAVAAPAVRSSLPSARRGGSTRIGAVGPIEMDAQDADAEHLDAEHLDAEHLDAQHEDAQHADAQHADALDAEALDSGDLDTNAPDGAPRDADAIEPLGPVDDQGTSPDTGVPDGTRRGSGAVRIGGSANRRRGQPGRPGSKRR